jgi:ribosome assembly protein YihI (activator of Der GTPase)
MSDNIIKAKPSQELIVLEDTILNTVLEQLSEGKTLASIRKAGTLPISLIKFYQFLNQEENKEIKARIEEARKIGVQNIVDKLLDIYQADINQDTLDPNLISWIREKTKFIQWIAGKTSNLYSDKKDLTLNKTTNQIIVSWLDSPELEQKYTQYESISEDKKEIIDQ